MKYIFSEIFTKYDTLQENGSLCVYDSFRGMIFDIWWEVDSKLTIHWYRQ